MRIDQFAALEGFARAVWPAKETRAPTPLESCEHACLCCRLAFATRQQWGAHAHRVHGYHSRAHVVSKGRQCQACGLRVATEAKLRTHLRLSLACVQRIEDLAAGGDIPVDLSVGHALEPAVPGVGKASLGPAAPEALPALTAALRAFQSTSADVDEELFEVVRAFIAPLPVLRRTLQQWASELLPGTLRDACADVLLVLHPQHLCDKVSGKRAEEFEFCAPFSPRIDPMPRALDFSPSPLLVVGDTPPPHFARRFPPECPTVWVSLDDLDAWTGRPVSGAFVSFRSPPAAALPVFDPIPCPVKVLRDLRAWTDTALTGLRMLLPLARSGHPVLVHMPCAPEALQPLTRWLSALSDAATGIEDAQTCFTFEFISSLCLH